ncbi:ent-3.2 family protein [Megaselia abdita]
MNSEKNEHYPFVQGKKRKLTPPPDKWKLVFSVFILHGLGTLMPWNMFITAKSYFVDFKLDTSADEYLAVNGTSFNSTVVADDDQFNYATNFLAYIGFAAQVPNVIFNWLNIFVNLGGDLTQRITWSISTEVVVFIVTIALAMVDSSSWPGGFFWITMLSVVILNMANGIYQNTVYGMAATLPLKYTGAVVLGSNVSGLFTSVIALVSDLIFDSPRTAAIYYFITAMFILMLCFDTYFALPLNKFFRFHTEVRELKSKDDEEDSDKIPFWTIFKQASPQLFNVFFVFFVTLSVFPAVYSDIKPGTDDFIIPRNYFVSITCFLTFNLFAMLGSLTTTWIQWPSPKFLVVPVILRVAFVPLFLFCNYQPRGIIRTLPVYINSDYIYWTIAILMSYSSGYLSSLGMMYAPQSVKGKHQITAGMFAAGMLITGIFMGISVSGFMPLILT